MDKYSSKILETLSIKDVRHFNKIKENISYFDDDYFIEANKFYEKYDRYLKSIGKDFSFSVDCYMKMVADINFEMVHFYRTGKYSSSDFIEVNKRVYNNPEIMDYYMHGLILSQFLWKQHYETYNFFHSYIKKFSKSIKGYLEIGAGHGLYLSKFIEYSDPDQLNDCTVIDVSQTSINFSKNFVKNDKINFICNDIFNYKSKKKFDLIVMGEVLEHVENPLKLLKELKKHLKKTGYLFITTPTNAPTIDHIYLFNNIYEIREMIENAGFNIIKENVVCSENASKEEIEIKKISEMYSAFLNIY